MYRNAPRLWKKNLVTLAISLAFALLVATPLVAGEDDSLLVGGFYNDAKFEFSGIDSSIQDIDRVFGYQITWLRDQGQFLFDDAHLRYGAHYYRVEGGSGSFMLNDGYEAVAEILYGDMKRVVQKRPFWEKLWYRAGTRVGTYRWIVLSGSSYTNINDQGFALTLYLAVGLGRLGSLEMSHKSLLTGSESASKMSNIYISYVYDFKL